MMISSRRNTAVADGDPPEPSVDPRERRLSVQSVEAVVARVQDLVDSRPPGEYPVAWCIEASCLGDLNAIAALAAIAGRSTQKG
jgi:hypothetical protein